MRKAGLGMENRAGGCNQLRVQRVSLGIFGRAGTWLDSESKILVGLGACLAACLEDEGRSLQ